MFALAGDVPTKPQNAQRVRKYQFLDLSPYLIDLRSAWKPFRFFAWGCRRVSLPSQQPRFPIMVVSEERSERCRRLIDVYGLSTLIAQVFSLHKTVDVFRELRRTIAKDRALMVGDQARLETSAALGMQVLRRFTSQVILCHSGILILSTPQIM